MGDAGRRERRSDRVWKDEALVEPWSVISGNNARPIAHHSLLVTDQVSRFTLCVYSDRFTRLIVYVEIYLCLC
jgi:hypothetical protein